jgi:protein-S-isoprenylcysteine O-methyltransferase Ste14
MHDTATASSIAAHIVTVVTIGAFLAGEVLQTFRGRRGGAATSPAGEAAFRVVFVVTVLLYPLILHVAPWATVTSRWVYALGVCVTWLGLLLRWYAFAALGRYFTTIVRVAPGHQLIVTGPYRWVRHPGYAGLIVVFFGGGLMLGNWLASVVCGALMMVVLVPRLLAEERMLAGLFDTYDDYARGRARLLPGVW